jgi:alkanesulfonate monooxygenase SsuD/methylene tetrahydromethanopterin reductase-like flavin-dependent oxidoreductase (luciferase family)
LRPSRLAALGDYILAVRDLHQNGRAKFKGNNLRLTWWSGKRIPILMAAHGPKSLQMAGQVADGVVVGVGLTPEATEYAFDHIERGAKKAGRDLKEIDVWFMSLLNLTDNADAPVSGIEASLAASGNLLARSDARATVPAKLHKKLDALAERYHYDHHTDNAPSSRNGLLLSELGLGPYLSERFGLAGTGHQVRERVHGLAARSVTCHWGMYHGRNRDDFLARWGREILDREIGY